MNYALVRDGSVVKEGLFIETPPILAGNKGVWLPLVNGGTTCGANQRLGERYCVIDGKQVLILNKVIDIPKEELIAQAKKEAMEKILSVAPYYKQINAALGVYTEEEKQEIINHIQQCREECEKKEIEINEYIV